MKKTISILLAVVLLATVFAGCGKNSEQSSAEVLYPVPTDAEAAVDSAAGLALNYYMTGRAYLDMFINYDTSTLDEGNIDEYKALVDNAVKAFENADKVNDVLGEALDIYEKEEKSEGPKVQKGMIQPLYFGMVANAAEMGSKEWAQNIMDEYAKAKPGYAIRHLAEQLGTDCKHAYAQMKMAQDVLMGAEYTKIADAANTAVKTATVLKTAGTAAQLGIAIATAPTTGTAAMIAAKGGIVIGGINTILEIGSTGSILYTNGEDNCVSKACDNVESRLAPIGQVFSIAGLGFGIADLAKTGGKAFTNGISSLSASDKENILVNTFGLFSYGSSTVNDYVNDGKILSGTFTKTDNGTKFTLFDTVLGGGVPTEKDFEVLKKAYENAGLSEKDAEAAIKAAEEATATQSTTAASGEQTTAPANEAQPTMNVNDIQPEVAQNIINNNKKIMDDFDLDAYLKKLREILYEIAEDAYGEEYEELNKNGKGDFIDTICGTYSMSVLQKIIGGGTLVFSETDSKELNTEYDVTVADAGNGQVTVTLSGDDYEGETVTATVDEASKKITFVYPYGYGYYFTDSYMTFEISGDAVNATLHMYGEGTNLNDEWTAESIDGTGTKN